MPTVDVTTQVFVVELPPTQLNTIELTTTVTTVEFLSEPVLPGSPIPNTYTQNGSVLLLVSASATQQFVVAPVVDPPAPVVTPLGIAAASLSPGTYALFNSAGTAAFRNNAGEPFVYWGKHFFWDAIRREAQAIGIGTGYTRMSHALYSDDANQWYATTPFDAPTVLGHPNLGHPYEWNIMTPDGTYWVKRSAHEALSFRRRANWSTAAWNPADKTPFWTASGSAWPESLVWHEAMGKAIVRIGTSVIALDLLQFLSTGTWSWQPLTNLPSVTTANKASIGYCRALNSAIAFGVNDATTQDNCYRIHANGSSETLLHRPPRWIINGNVLVGTTQDRLGMYVDDPRGETAYIFERQPASALGSARIWRMNNVGTSWDGSWTQIGTTDMFAAGSGQSGPCYLCPVSTYGVVWILRQPTPDACDSFLWKPI